MIVKSGRAFINGTIRDFSFPQRTSREYQLVSDEAGVFQGGGSVSVPLPLEDFPYPLDFKTTYSAWFQDVLLSINISQLTQVQTSYLTSGMIIEIVHPGIRVDIGHNPKQWRVEISKGKYYSETIAYPSRFRPYYSYRVAGVIALMSVKRLYYVPSRVRQHISYSKAFNVTLSRMKKLVEVFQRTGKVPVE